jgi:MFS family permease
MPADPSPLSGGEVGELGGDGGDTGRLGRAFTALRYPDFRTAWVAAIVSNTGTWVQAITVPFVIYTLTGQALWVGLASFAQFVPFVLAGPWAGSLADRLPRRTVLIVTNALALGSASLLALVWAAGVRSPAVMVAILAVSGLAGGLGAPSWQALVAELVPRSVLLNAISLNSAQFNAARAFGPALGGLVLAGLGPAWAFTINALSYVAVIGALVVIRAGRRGHGEVTVARPGVLREFAGTVAYMRGQRGIAACVVTVVGLCFLTSPVSSLLVVFAEDVFGVGRARYGFLGAALGLGAVLATPFVSSRNPQRRRGPFIGAALALNGLAAVGFALAPGYWAGLGALLVMGAAYLAVAAGLNTTLQLLVDDARRGRVIAVYLMALTVALPLGALLQGWLVDQIGPRPTVAEAGLALVAVAGLLAATGRLRAMDESPAPQPQPVAAVPSRTAAAQPSASGHHLQAGPGR